MSRQKKKTMTWMTIDSDTVIIDTDVYIQSQPVGYDQVVDVIKAIRARGVPIRARIDVSRLRLSQVSILGVVDVIWDLHEATRDENLLDSIELLGASPRIRYVWEAIQRLLPEFVRSVTIMV